MKVTYNWLKEYVHFNLTPDQLAELLTMLGLEVEGMEKLGDGMDDVVIARVEEKQQHPNADKLSLCKVNNGSEILNVVCGAQNFKQGDTVVLAQIGSILPGDFKIKRSKIRGEESCGMLCSGRELGLAEESTGIMVLDAAIAPLGTPVFSALGLKDTLFEIGLTPNRADCLSAIGIAREIAAKLGGKASVPVSSTFEGIETVESAINISINDPEYCPRYAARYISGCKIAPSPEWLINRLASIGIRSINNVVDVTNFVMMEMGQPLHAFDCDQLTGRGIVVRRAGEGECFVTLDSQKRILTNQDLVICDLERPVALAGIMGGQNSEITDSTVNILLESAYFLASAVRKTSKRLGLHTESSHRFERGVDVGGVTRALNRAASLIVELAGGSLAKGCLDMYPGKAEIKPIVFRPQRANDLIGISLQHDEISSILQRLECGVNVVSEGVFAVTPPSYRVDIEREIDLIEEIARLNGFDCIPVTMPNTVIVSDRPTRHLQLQKEIRNLLVAQGMNEVINFSFTAPGALDRLLLADNDPRKMTIKLANPLVEEQSVMRTSLVPGLLETLARNVSFRSLDLKLFEMRRVYLPVSDQSMPHEPIVAVGVLTGSRSGDAWCQASDPMDFYDVKGIVESILINLNIGGIKWVADSPESYYHPGKSCSVYAGKTRIGSLGEIHPTVQVNFGIEKPVYCFELEFEKLVEFSRNTRTISAPSRYPDSTRDIAILVNDDVQADAIMACVNGIKAHEVERAEIFDVYRGKGIPEGSKSVGIRIRYRAEQRTLTDDEISSIHTKISSVFVSKLNAVIR